jgi:hypothetical protein
MRRHLAILLTLAVLPLSAGAQSAAPWDAFLGCWTNAEAPERQERLCYVPTAASVSVADVIVLSGDSVVSRTRLDARGTRQPVVAQGCDGFEVTERSLDGVRLYTRGEVRCGASRQLTSSLLTLSPRGELVRVSAVMVGEQQALVTERLAPVPISNAPFAVRSELESVQMRVRGARVAAMRLLSVEQIEAALQETDAVVVEAWMVEATRDTTGFRAPRRALERLAAAGAPDGVLDMAVMLGNPDYFDVHGAASERGLSRLSGMNAWSSNSWAFCSMPAPLLWTPEMSYMAMFGYGSLYSPYLFNNGCDPWAYANRFGFRVLAWNMFSPWFGGVNRWDPRFGRGVIVTPVSGGSLARTIPLGRVEKGRGYAPSNTSGRSGGAAPRSEPVNVRQPASASNARAGSSSSGSSAGSSSSGTRARTESSSSTGRTAEPRKPD